MADDRPSPAERIPWKRLREFVSFGALLFALVHIIWPQLAIDAVTLTLLVIAILPWLAPLVKSLELPGGWKVEFQELQKAASRAESAGLLAPQAAPLDDEAVFSFQSIASKDPVLALAGLRIEIERRLSALVRARDLSPKRRPLGVGQSLRLLTQAEVLTNEQRSILEDMVALLNDAVHGAQIDQRAAAWAIDVGPRLLQSLDERMTQADMNIVAADALQTKRQALAEAANALRTRLDEPERAAFDTSQAKWEEYCDAWAQFVAGDAASGGTIRPLLHAREAETLVDQRIAQIRGYRRLGE